MNPAPSGRLITLEGGEGVGKSTLARGLAEALKAKGRSVLITREPGGSPGADAIRELLVRGEAERWGVMAEALLLAAARADHLQRTIQPALARGDIVICDRYVDSTRAYQVEAGGLDRASFETINRLIAAPAPDLTLILDLDPALGLGRSRGSAAGEDRYERKPASFHAAVRAAFQKIAADEPGRCVLIDAAQGQEAVLRQALEAIEGRL